MDNTIQKPQSIIVEENDFVHRVYGWMSAGLFITAIVAFTFSTSTALVSIFIENILVFYGLLIAELLAVIYLSRAINNMQSSTAGFFFLLYSVLNGITFSIIFLIYTTASIGSVFIITAGMFAIMSLYGYLTKTDLTSVGNFAFMALIGLILASVVNIFIRNDSFTQIISYIGVLVFVALTAYDTQKIKNMNATVNIGSEEEKKASIMGALALYLDFINLFLNLLRIMGKRK